MFGNNIIRFAISRVFILSGMQKVCPKNMLGRLMAVFNTLNSLMLPIGIWLHGILYETWEKKSTFYSGLLQY